ncbi:hypothetical protein BTN82_30450 [Pseudomonas chlororaphis]|uniref:Lipoprotein n=1 Tax=Pseudomonas chlororaphis TaxID=587753 RepID=A0A1Q8EGW7_9PSED|nr:hypothetical protein BTN82_30450 [Pseudomonas chlororaphis]
MRRIVCRRFGVSICLGAWAAGCKNDRGIAESVKERQRVCRALLAPSVLCHRHGPESAASSDLGRRNETDPPGFGTAGDWRTRG